MKSNQRNKLFLILWLLFFVLIIVKEYSSDWIPVSLKAKLVESQIQKDIDLAEEQLDIISQNNSFNFEDLVNHEIDFPLFVFKDDKLVYWNNNTVRAPSSQSRFSRDIQFQDAGFSKSLILKKTTSSKETYLVSIPLWKNVGIENEWLDQGSNPNYSFNWILSDEASCEEVIEFGDDIRLGICFHESKGWVTNQDSGIIFILILLFLILIALFYDAVIDAFEIENNDSKKYWLSITSISLIVLTFLFEYFRRFLFEPSPDSVFFVIYPYILALPIALLIQLKGIKISIFKGFESVLIPVSIIAIYVFCKSYWIEIYDKENFDLDLVNFVRLEWKTLDAYLGLFGMSLVFYLVFTSLLNYSLRAKINSKLQSFAIISLSIAGFLVEGFFNGEWYIGYFIIALLFISINNGLFSFRKEFQQGKLLYYIAYILLISIFITETSHHGNHLKNRNSMLAFANKVTNDRANIEKELLKNTAVQIGKDKLIYIAFTNPLTSKEIIKQKIKKVYLDSYFDPFEVNIDFLNINGDNLNLQAGYRNLFYFQSNFLKDELKVAKNVYRLENDQSSKRSDYYLHIPLRQNSSIIGHLIIEVYQDKSSPNSIFPKLLVDKKYVKFNEDEFVSKFYSINSQQYESFKESLSESTINQISSLKNGEYIFDGSNSEISLLYKTREGFLNVKESIHAPLLSNFSIAFMVLSVLAFICYTLISNDGFRPRDLPFRRKIQFFMNLAFLLPLMVVSLAVLKFMNDNDKENVEINYLKKVNAITRGVEIPFLDFKNGLIPKRVFIERASDAASLFSLDFFIYNNDGSLNSSSKEILWERGISNRLIDPIAFHKLKFNEMNEVILESRIDNFRYKISYVYLKDLNQKNIGILGVPFFDSGEESESRFIQLLSTVINIFVFSFIVFLLFSNRLTDWLMIPVLRLGDKIRDTSFEFKNEPLEWNTEDEIGNLVDSYNDMIDKLNESRDALARTEKEAAWREMAQQVAHEIKNPLTPMRLRLQQLIRKNDGSKGEEDEKLKQTLNSLLHQVDTLSEIASSFSEFARMPNPKNEKVNLNEVIQLASNIYLGKKSISLNVDIPKETFFSNADENMLSRSLGNIILNGIQSVDEDTAPKIDISLKASEEMAEIRIKDNGHGIDEEIQDRIFIPHFSTKSGGTGIGLALAKKTIESASGTIQFISGHNGTEFVIQLPLFRS